MFACLRKGVPERVLGIWSGLFREVLSSHFLDLDANLKLTGFQLALLGFEDLALGLDGVLLQVLLVCKNLGDVRHEIRYPAGFRREDLLRLSEGLQGLLLIGHGIGSLGLGNLLNGPCHMGNWLALKEG